MRDIFNKLTENNDEDGEDSTKSRSLMNYLKDVEVEVQRLPDTNTFQSIYTEGVHPADSAGRTFENFKGNKSMYGVCYEYFVNNLYEWISFKSSNSTTP